MKLLACASLLIGAVACSSPTHEQVKKAGPARNRFKTPLDEINLINLQKEAEQGDPASQEYLGTWYAGGLRVTQDDAEAARWFRKAADQGHAKAQSSLGYMYYEGRAVPQDYIEAHKCLTLATFRAKGPEKSTNAATRDFVATKMTHEQIAEAQRRAREWKPTLRPTVAK